MIRTLVGLYIWLVWAFHLFIPGPLAVLCVAISPRHLGFWATYAVVRSAMFFSGIRVQALGRERVDWSKTYVFMGNHQTMLDPFAMILAIRQHVVVVEKIELQRMPIYGWLSRAWGNIPIQREDQASAREGISEAAERLKSGLSIGIMPEGTRTKDGSVGPFKKGGFHMAIDAQAEIVPFTYNGSFERLPPGDWRPRPGLITIEFGTPIPTAGLTKDDMDGLMTRVRSAVLEHFNPGV